MKRSMRKRKIAAITIWIVWVILFSGIFYLVEDGIIRNEVREELLGQTQMIAGRIPQIGENHFYARAGAEKSRFAGLKALAMALDETEDIESARELLEGLPEAAGMDGLAIYDREGDALYKTGNTDTIDFSPETIQNILDNGAFEQMDQVLTWNDAGMDSLFSSRILDDTQESNVSCWSAHQGRWLIASCDTPTETEKKVTDYFDWRNVFRQIRIGDTGGLLAFDKTDGTVLSWEDRKMEGQPLDSLGIRIGGKADPAGLEELKNIFSGDAQTAEIQIGDKTYLAARVEDDHLLTLEMLPLDEIHGKTMRVAAVLSLLLLFTSGCCLGYVYFHLDAKDETVQETGNHFIRNKTLARKLCVVGIVAVLFVFLGATYLESLSVYANTFSYSREKVSRVVEVEDDNGEAVEELQDWYDDIYLSRGKLARYILVHTENEKNNREFLEKLAACLGIRSISMYDDNGRLIAGSSRRSLKSIPDDSPYAAVLDGEEEETGGAETDETTGKTTQTIGISLRNPDRDDGGMILIEADSEEMDAIRRNLDFKSIFEQICLADKTCVLVIKDGDLTIESIGEVKDGTYQTGMNGYDYTGLHAKDIGIDERLLLDHYNGEMLVLQNRYFASARREGDHYFLVMRPQINVSDSHMTPVALAVAGMAVFMILLLLVSCTGGKAEAESTEDNPKTVAAGKAKNMTPNRKKEWNDDVLNILKNMVDNKKPYFEQRWAKDCVKWKDRKPEEKFSIFLKVVTMISLISIILYSALSGEDSIWYYCLNGEWSSGINLYSITSCLIDISILLIIKIVLHKVLFWIARAVKAKGETICFLLDSFSSYVLAIVGIFVCLAALGVDLTTLSLTGGVLGVLFSIGCQHIVADILAGILMTFEGVVHVGDFVTYNGNYSFVLSIGVRTTLLKWYGDITIVRNDDFKNYINRPGEMTTRVTTTLTVDLSESMDRVEAILDEELPKIHDKLCEISESEVKGPVYREVRKITENGAELSFAIYCKGMYYGFLNRALNRELKAMCDRRGIKIAMQQMVLHEAEEKGPETSAES